MNKTEPDPLGMLEVLVECPRWQEMELDYTQHSADLFRKVVWHLYGGRVILSAALLLSDDAALKQLNKKFLGKNTPTNVLSFPFSQELSDEMMELAQGRSAKVGEGDLYIGDIAVSYDTIKREADAQNKTFHSHFTHILMHGVLHLLGYDHINDEDSLMMEGLEIEILQQVFNITNPYVDGNYVQIRNAS